MNRKWQFATLGSALIVGVGLALAVRHSAAETSAADECLDLKVAGSIGTLVGSACTHKFTNGAVCVMFRTPALVTGGGNNAAMACKIP
jgi:hypothetical protein